MNCAIQYRLNKNRGLRRFFCLNIQSILFRSFYHRANATGAKQFLNLTSAFEYRNLLKIWFKFSIGSTHRKAAIMTKSRCFSTIFTLCHNKNPFNRECLDYDSTCTSQQSGILPYHVSFYKNWVI